jgi:cytochrome P450
MKIAYRELMNFMEGQVAERKVLVQKSRTGELELGKDVFTMLVQANEDEGAKYKLDNQELVSFTVTRYLRLRAQLLNRLGMCMPCSSQVTVR